MKINQNAPGQIFGQRSIADVAKSTVRVNGQRARAQARAMGTGANKDHLWFSLEKKNKNKLYDGKLWCLSEK